MRKSYSIIFFMLIIILSACSGNKEANTENSKGSAGKAVELDLSHVLTEDSSFHAAAKKLSELVEERTSGEVKIKIFPAGQLGGEVQSIQAARNGNQDLIITGTPALTATAPEFLALDLPYLFENVDEANGFLQGSSGEALLSGLSKYGLVGLGFNSALERNVFSKKPIKNLDDFKNLNIRVVQSDGYIHAYNALGAQPTPMPYSEVYLSLQQGVIDAGEAAADTMITDKFMEVSSHYNLTKSHFYPVVLLMSEKSMEKLSKEQQEIIKQSAKEATQAGIEYYKDSYKKSLELLKEDGIEIVETDTAAFKKATQGLRDEFIKNNPNLSPDLIELIKN